LHVAARAAASAWVYVPAADVPVRRPSGVTAARAEAAQCHNGKADDTEQKARQVEVHLSRKE
jgi:hypothetical protein